MKVVAFNGSPRPDGNTAAALRIVLDVLAGQGIDGEIIQVGGVPLRGCQSCYACVNNKARFCAFGDDPLNGWIGKIMDADGVILGSPVYFFDVTSEMKALIDRAGFVARANGRMFARKAAAAVTVQRRAGAMTTLDTMTRFFASMQMFIVGGVNNFVALRAGEAADDAEGQANMRTLGENMALLLKMMEAYRGNR